MISLLLLYKILQLYIFLFLGFVLVKAGVVKSEDSRVLSKLSLYLFMPSVILNSFDISMTEKIAKGLTTAFISAIVIHIVLLLIDVICKCIFRASNVERASIIYSNAGNLIIPIVSFLLGDEWIVYTTAFISVQILFLWTHGISLFSKDKKPNIRKIIFNVNIIAIVIGIVMMLCGIRLPKLAKDVVSSLGSMLGPMGMVIAGMVAAKINYCKEIRNPRMYFVIFARLVICPVVSLLIMKIAKLNLTSDFDKVLLISFLASITPAAATVMQFAQITGNNEEYATTINIFSTFVCVVTMPVLVWLFEFI